FWPEKSAANSQQQSWKTYCQRCGGATAQQHQTSAQRKRALAEVPRRSTHFFRANLRLLLLDALHRVEKLAIVQSSVEFAQLLLGERTGVCREPLEDCLSLRGARIVRREIGQGRKHRSPWDSRNGVRNGRQVFL